MIPEPLANAVYALTAVLGLYVAYLAYQGYRQNDSPVMRALATGIVAIAVLPYIINYTAPLFALTDAQVILLLTLSHTVGLLAIYRTFR
mgnify:CR=1 FL=1